MKKIQLLTNLFVAFNDPCHVWGDYEGMECKYCREQSEEPYGDVEHAEGCLHVEMRKYMIELGYTEDDFEAIKK